ncbi:glycosyltransferase family protein [Empedobacter falsenii]
MLSIIISSFNVANYNNIVNNIKTTIGNDFIFEIVKIDNNGIYSLTEVYNIGGDKSLYENLLFIHEDILFDTQDWGNILIEILNIKNCGVVGVAGGSYYGYIPSSWWNEGYKFLNFIQINNGNTIENNRINFKNDNEKVVILDGVFLACKKMVFDTVKFDERIKGFHGYDLIYSLQVSKKYQNYVTSNILIKHFSAGNLDKHWFQNLLKVREIVGYKTNSTFDVNVELSNFYKLINYLNKYGYTYKESIKIIFPFLNIRLFGVINIIKMLNRLRYL